MKKRQARITVPVLGDAIAIDPECADLCNALNELPGVRTWMSCSGHGKRRYWIVIFAKAGSPKLAPLLRALKDEHLAFHRGGWSVEVYLAEPENPPFPFIAFKLKGPVGAKAYREAKSLAVCIRRKKRAGGTRRAKANR